MGSVFGRWPHWLSRRRLVPRVFDPAGRRWVEAADDGSVRCDALTLTTFNVWFAEHHAAARYTAIADLLARTRPDVMAFQEVTPAALAVLLAQDWVRRDYRCAAVVGDRSRYGLMLLSRVPLSGVVHRRLPTRRGRAVLRADLRIDGAPVTVCCLHLDSGKASAGLRARQLHRMHRLLADADDAVVLGDFNLRDDENGAIPAAYRDVWPLLRPDAAGYTEDTAVNLMLREVKGAPRQVRFDRVLLRGPRWRPAAIELLGTEPIDDDSPRVFPSDHFGVLCRIVSATA